MVLILSPLLLPGSQPCKPSHSDGVVPHDPGGVYELAKNVENNPNTLPGQYLGILGSAPLNHFRTQHIVTQFYWTLI